MVADAIARRGPRHAVLAVAIRVTRLGARDTVRIGVPIALQPEAIARSVQLSRRVDEGFRVRIRIRTCATSAADRDRAAASAHAASASDGQSAAARLPTARCATVLCVTRSLRRTGDHCDEQPSCEALSPKVEELAPRPNLQR